MVTLKPLLVLPLDTHTLVAVIIKVSDLDVSKPRTGTASCDDATPPRNPENHLPCLYLTCCLDLTSRYFIHNATMQLGCSQVRNNHWPLPLRNVLPRPHSYQLRWALLMTRHGRD